MSNRKIYDAWNEYKNKNVYIKKTKFCREIGCSVDYLNKTIRKFSSESEAPESYKNRDTNKKLLKIIFHQKSKNLHKHEVGTCAFVFANGSIIISSDFDNSIVRLNNNILKIRLLTSKIKHKQNIPNTTEFIT